MFKIRALKNEEQIQLIEYSDLFYGLQQMHLMHPECLYEITDLETGIVTTQEFDPEKYYAPPENDGN